MSFLLYYLDKFTRWLDFSWLVTLEKKAPAAPPTYSDRTEDLPPTYVKAEDKVNEAEDKVNELKEANYKRDFEPLLWM